VARDDQNPTVVRLDGDIDVRSIAAAHEKLLRAFENGGDVVCDLAGLGAADLTLVQLIESARRAAQCDGRAFSLAAPVSGALHEILRRGGFLDAEAASHRAFWLHQTGTTPCPPS
jgi:anti-anti-sigma regulatory factor